jgi:hypothetical protein
VEGENVHIVQDGSDDDPKPWNPARRWRLAAVTAIGLVVAVLVLVPALRSTEEPPSNLSVAAAASPTTTTLWLSAGTLLVRTESLCRAINPPGLRTSDEWVESVFVEGGPNNFVVKGDVRSFGIASEVARARNEQDFQLVAILDPILADLQQALDSVDNAFVALRDEAPDRWQHQVDLAERYCERATAALELIVSTLYAD